MSDVLSWLWLGYVLGHGASNAAEILDVFESPDKLFAAVGKENLSGWLTEGQLNRLDAKPEHFSQTLANCRVHGIQILTPEDENYPRALKRIPSLPPVLFCTGNPQVLNTMPTVGMIGSRRPSEYGVQAAGVIGGRLAKEGVCIVSGLADGLDGESHRAAVKNNGVTVGILGTCIDKTYPSSNSALRSRMEEKGAVLSEYAPGERTNQGSFLLRNRLIAALSDALCVVEARQKSGTMNTVHHAQDFGKIIFAVPGPIFSNLCAGTNELLETGTAKAAASALPILESLGIDVKNRPENHTRAPKPKLQLSAAAKAALDVLTVNPMDTEQIANAADLNMAAALAALLELEISGLAQGLAGGLYRRK